MTTENNRLIAEFLGFKERLFTDSKGVTTKTYSLPNPKTSNGLPLLKIHKEKSLIRYSSDWNWLMEVVEKIAPLISESEFKYRIGNDLLSVNKEGVYNACVEFIKWYSENSAQKE